LIKQYKEHKPGAVKEGLREDILMINAKLVASTANKFAAKTKTSVDDYFQAGMMGLSRALDGFDHSRGFCFSTYALPWIRNYMWIEKLQETSIPITRGAKNAFTILRKRGGGVMDLSGGGIAEYNAQQAMNAISDGNYLYLNKPITVAHEALDIFPELADPTNLESSIFHQLEMEDVLDAMNKVLNSKELMVMKEMYFGGGGQSREAVANVTGVKASAVRKMEALSLRKLRAYFARLKKSEWNKKQEKETLDE